MVFYGILELKCIFRPNTVTSETIVMFPSACDTVCADLLFNMDLPEDNLTQVFGSMKHLTGNLAISCTNYSNTQFLEALETVHSDRIPIFLQYSPGISSPAFRNPFECSHQEKTFHPDRFIIYQTILLFLVETWKNVCYLIQSMVIKFDVKTYADHRLSHFNTLDMLTTPVIIQITYLLCNFKKFQFVKRRIPKKFIVKFAFCGFFGRNPRVGHGETSSGS
uniref:Vomeronasal type-2 receptor 26-like n=1 Tax=Caenorhabditis tropicalis TaxID=1561998 RepID=A0A1I7U3S4_9PELO